MSDSESLRDGFSENPTLNGQVLEKLNEVLSMKSKLDDVLSMQSKLGNEVHQIKKQNSATIQQQQSQPQLSTSGGDLNEITPRQSIHRKSSGNQLNLFETAQKEPEELAPVLTGDYIVLQDLDASSPGFVTGDAAFERCGIQMLPNNQRASLDYDDYVFQIFPSMVYRSQIEMASRKLTRAPSFTSSRRSASFNENQESEEKSLEDRALLEQKQNKILMNDVMNGNKKEPLRYGQLIQLKHVKTGQFISCHHTAAMRDTSCRKVSLREGSVSAQFSLLPCYKAQTEGSVVFYTHSIKLGSVKLNGLYLHSSHEIYENINNSNSNHLPRKLRNEKIYELNASAKYTTFVIKSFGTFKENANLYMKTSFSPFRLYHSQSESFVTASGCSDKNLNCNITSQNKYFRNPIFKKENDNNYDDHDHNQTNENNQNNNQFETMLPLHIPYLRNIDQNVTGEEPDPTDQRNHITKSVWVFESLTRTSCSTLSWGDPVRIRHVPSRRYLCVDTSAPTYAVPPNEKWYRTYLVDDPTFAHKEEDLDDGNQFGMNCLSDNAIFRVECDGSTSSNVPLHDSNVRIEFRPEHSSVRLFLHNTEMKKPPQMIHNDNNNDDNSIAIQRKSNKVKKSHNQSLMLVFSTVRSAQDTLKLMPISHEEAIATYRAQAFIPPVLAYSIKLSDHSIPIPTLERFQETMYLLISIIDFQSKGKSELPKIDWIKKANSMLPSAFSSLFDSEPDPLTQRISCDTKLLDAIFLMSLAPYQRLKDPFPRDDTIEAAGIQKLVHVALQRMFIGSNYCQLYVGHQSANANKLLQEGSSNGLMPWIEIIKLQLEDPLGSAVSLAKLLSSNKKLLEDHATPSMVSAFARMIRELGPQPRLVNFFEAICTSNQLPVKANQEMIVRMTWMDPRERSKLYLEVGTIPKSNLQNSIYTRKLDVVKRLPGGDLNNGKVISLRNDSSMKNQPSGYLGQAEYEEGLDPVFIRWKGTPTWTQKQDDYLFWSPSELVSPLTSIEYMGNEHVRIEEFCWVLEPERLCEPITGNKWKSFLHKKDSDDILRLKFTRQEQLATYFIAEMKMLTNLCFGRSYNCISMLESSFPYTMLISMSKNEHLPSVLRAVTLDLTRVLYLDRFPQMPNCARPTIPEMLWVYEAPNMSEDDLIATPVIRKISLKPNKNDTALALPCFQIPKAHKLSNHSDPLYGFPDQFKFCLLRTTCNDIITSFASGRINHNNRAMNQLASATVKVISDLLSFGFQSSYEKINALLKGLVRLLDGRNDVRSLNDVDDENEEAEEEEFRPLLSRFELTTNSPSVTSVKIVILDVFISVSDFRTQFRLGKMMQIFKDYTEDSTHLKELKIFHDLVIKLHEKYYDGFLTDELYNQFEDLFTQGDGKLLDFELLTSAPLNTILLDCLMYKDDILHAKALELLERTFTQRKRLITAVEDVILLHRAPYYAQLNAEIGYLVYLLRSTEVWGISSKISGSFDIDKQKECFEKCDRVIKYLNEPSEQVDVNDGKSKMALMYNTPADSLTANVVGLSNLMTSGVAGVAGGIAEAGNVMKQFNAQASRNDHEIELNPMLNGEHKEDDDDDDDNDDGAKSNCPVHEHQDVLRAMNLQLALTKALAIDYNLVFKGSICSPEDKIESRNIHIGVMRKVIEMMTDFVSGNEKNQEIIFLTSLTDLRYHLGDLKLPINLNKDDYDEFENNPKFKSQLITQPGLNSESVIIECLKGNIRLCSEEIPRILFEEFGELLNNEPEVSESRLLEFFHITMLPNPLLDSLFRNQESTLDVLLSPKFVSIKSNIESVFFMNYHQSLPPNPENIINLLSTCIMNQNGITSSRLQANGYSIDATIYALSKVLDKIELKSNGASDIMKEITLQHSEHHHHKRGSGLYPSCGGGGGGGGGGLRESTVMAVKEQAAFHSKEYTESRKIMENLLLNDAHFTSLLMFLSHQLRSLVIDPRLFRNDHIWRVLTDGLGLLISKFANDIENYNDLKNNKEIKKNIISKEIPIIIPTLRIVHDFVNSAQRMSAEDAMLAHQDPLKGHNKKYPHSVFASILRIRKILDHSDVSSKLHLPNKLLKHQEKFIVALRKLQYVLVPGSQSKNEDDVDIVLNKFNEQSENNKINSSNKLKSNHHHHKQTSDKGYKESPAVCLSYFVEALTHNSKIKDKLLSRRFDFLDLLEKAEQKTNPDYIDPNDDDEFADDDDVCDIGRNIGNAFAQVGKTVNTIGDVVGDAVQNVVSTVGQLGPNGNNVKFGEPEYGVKITWSMLVDRLVDFAQAHNFDKDESNIIRVHNVLKNHILKSRSDGQNVLETSDMDIKQLESYRKAQIKLDEKNVTRMALSAISTHTPGLRGTAAVSAIELLQELLYSGNSQVQESVLYYIEHIDKDSRFLKHIRSRLQESTRVVKERGEQVSSGYIEMTRDQRLEYEEAEQTLNLLSEMMEGHNLKLQNILRSQPLQSADVDLLKMVLDLLEYQASQSHFLVRLGKSGVGLLLATLDFVIESMQGPCTGNQLSLINNEAILAAVKNILVSKYSTRLDKFTIMKLKSKAILVIAASLEGRRDLIIHEFLANQLDYATLNKFASEANDFIKSLNNSNEITDYNNNIIDDNKESEEAKRSIIDEACMQGLVALTNIKTEMSLIKSFADAERLMLAGSPNKKGFRRPKIEAEVKMMKSTVASVEVLWNERIEFVSFPLPLETEYLSQSSKELFLEKVDLSTHEKRMKELIKAEPNLTAEMQQVYSLAQQSNIYKFMHQNFQAIKMVQYALVLLLNLNVVMASYGQDKETEPHGKEDLGYSSAFHAAFVGGMKKEYSLSLALTFILGVPNFLGYFFIMAFMGITEVPIIIRLIDNNVHEKRLEAQSGAEVRYRDPGAFTWWGVTLIFNIVFIIQHQAAYPNDPQYGLYLFLVFGINLPWTLLCIRNYILVADTSQARVFCIGFDTLVTKPFFRNQLFLVFCSINGFRFSSYFTLMLLDVVNISPTIQSLVKSVTKPAPQLGIVAYLFVIMVIIFASFGLDYFEDFFIYDSDYDDDADDLTGPNPYGCHSVVACFWLIMYKGVPAGSMDEVLDVIDNRDPQYLGRVFFDLAFFIIVGIFLFNIITGLMVDTFSALREEAQARSDQLDNECYVCGFTRTVYDDLGLPSPSFDHHKDRSHYIWNYLYFIQYLQQKDQTEFSGVESYVFSMLQSKSQDWLPARTSFAAQNHGISNEDEDIMMKTIESKLSKIDDSLESFKKKFHDIDVQMNRMNDVISK
jgi:hypothetical protein